MFNTLIESTLIINYWINIEVFGGKMAFTRRINVELEEKKGEIVIFVYFLESHNQQPADRR